MKAAFWSYVRRMLVAMLIAFIVALGIAASPVVALIVFAIFVVVGGVPLLLTPVRWFFEIREDNRVHRDRDSEAKE
jgi:hypothetical protein